MPTPIFVCGAECNVAAAGVAAPTGLVRHWSLANNVGFNVAEPGGGSQSFWIAASSSVSGMQHTFATAVGSPAVLVSRFYIKFHALPTEVATTLNLFSVIGFVNGGLRWNPGSGGFVEAFIGTATAGSFVPTLDRWYRIDIRTTLNTTSTTEWQVDGVAQTTATVASTASTCSAMMVGDTGATVRTDHSIDHIAVSATSADYPIGPGACYGLYPNVDGAHLTGTAGFQKHSVTAISDATTDAYTELANPLNTGSYPPAAYINQQNNATTRYVEFQFADLPSGLASVNGVAGVATLSAASTTACAASLKVHDGATDDAWLTDVDTSEAGFDIAYKCYAKSPASALAWTVADVNALRARWGFASDANPDPWLCGLMLEADVVPIVAGTSYPLNPRARAFRNSMMTR